MRRRRIVLNKISYIYYRYQIYRCGSQNFFIHHSRRQTFFYLASGTYLFVAAAQADCLFFMVGRLSKFYRCGSQFFFTNYLRRQTFFYNSFAAAQTFLMQRHIFFVAAAQADCLLFMVGAVKILSRRLSRLFYKSFVAAQTFLMQRHKLFF